MKPLTLVLGLFAAGLLASGLLLGFGRSVYDPAGFDCGSAFRENGDLRNDELGQALRGRDGESECDRVRSDASQLPIVLLVLAGVMAAGVPLSSRVGSPSTPDARESSPRSA